MYYLIPANYTDAGKILGMFAIRNVVEALILALPLLFFGTSLPIPLTWKTIVGLTLAIPLGGLALLGVGDDPLSICVWTWLRWHKARRILEYRGECA